MENDEAKVNVTYQGQNGDLNDPVYAEGSDAEIKTWVCEALQSGSVAGVGVHTNADLADFVVDRYQPTEERPYTLIQVRPKAPFGE